MEKIGKNIKVFCIFDKEQELVLFLKSALSYSRIERYLISFSENGVNSINYPSSINNGFRITNVLIPKKITVKWKTFELVACLKSFLTKLKMTEEKQYLYFDFSQIKIRPNLVKCIETSFEENLTEPSLNISFFSLFLEKNLSYNNNIICKLVLQYPYLCMNNSQICPNFYFENSASNRDKFPSNIRDLYQPIQILVEELEKLSMEQDYLNKEHFMLKTRNNILEASLSSILLMKKKEKVIDSSSIDLITLLEYHDLKQKYSEQSQMLSAIIHDLKSPLASIQGFAELLRDGLAGPVTIDIKNHLEVIVSNSKRLTKMVESILEFEKYNSSDFVAEKKRFDLVELIEETKISVLPQMIQKGEEFNIYTPDKLEIVANRELIFRVFQNILDNAIKYTPYNKGKIELFAEEQSIKGYKIIKITIKDNGFGFSNENLIKAFIPFMRFDPVSKSTGLGLPISKKIIEEIHGGSVEIKSKGKNKGTTVLIVLPKC